MFSNEKSNEIKKGVHKSRDKMKTNFFKKQVVVKNITRRFFL